MIFSGIFSGIRSMGRTTLGFVGILGGMTLFGLSMLTNLVKPPYRLRALVEELYKQGVLSLTIICVSGFTVGMVLGLQGYNTLVRFGATESLGAVVGLSLVRELGPVLTGLLTTGRAGSATTAEIATMSMTEQLDGLRMMSADPMHVVVLPRALAIALSMPMLSAMFTLCGMTGGFVVAVGFLGGDSGTYISNLQSSINFESDVYGSLVKSCAFGLLLALISTYLGYVARRSAAGVSSATTATVVATSVSILVFDYIITALLGV